MIKLKKNGFTFIEMLGVITLLAIISVIVIVVIDKSLKDSKEALYEAQMGNIRSAAKMWMADNIELIPDDGYYTITLGTLQSSGYIGTDIENLIEEEVYNSSLLIRISMNDVVISDNSSFVPYTSLDYIETDGNQYVDLDYMAKTNTEIRLDIELIENENTFKTSDSGYVNLIGIKSIKGDDRFAVNFGSDTSNAGHLHLYYWVDKKYDGVNSFKKYYSQVTNRSTLILKSGTAIFQDISHTIEQKTANNIDGMILLGGYNSNHGVVVSLNRYNAKVYGFKIYEGDTIVRDMIPCYRNSDGVAGLYDLVNNIFYDSDGSSEFIYSE